MKLGRRVFGTKLQVEFEVGFVRNTEYLLSPSGQ